VQFLEILIKNSDHLKKREFAGDISPFIVVFAIFLNGALM
jgi:hypothetical protein